MSEYICIVGFDEPEYTYIKSQVDLPVIAHETLPRILVKDGVLWVESGRGSRFVQVSKLIYHSIFENDLDFIAAVALWGGPCLPNARAMMDCRLKLPCLVRALQHTCFGQPARGYAAPLARFDTDVERVAKWGNWHCGENKARFTGAWTGEEASVIEHYLVGNAVRVVMVGDQYWQIRLDGDDWLKSIHHENATFMAVDDELLDDTRNIQKAFGLEIIANDYIVTGEGAKHLLEVNHIPNVTRFPEIWDAYSAFAVNWITHTIETCPA